MKKLISFIILSYLVLTVTCQTLIVSGLDTLVSHGTTTLNTHPYNVNFPVPKAAWIWNENWNKHPENYNERLTFFKNFKIHCFCKQYKIYATADNIFRAYINGRQVLRGNSWPTVYSAIIPEQYLNNGGDNTLTIVAANYSGPAGVIYGIVGLK